MESGTYIRPAARHGAISAAALLSRYIAAVVVIALAVLATGCSQPSRGSDSAGDLDEKLTEATNAPSSGGWCQVATADEIDSVTGFSPDTVINMNDMIPTAQVCEYGTWDGDLVKIGALGDDEQTRYGATCGLAKLSSGTAGELCDFEVMGTSVLMFDFQPDKRAAITLHHRADNGAPKRAAQVKEIAQLIFPRLSSVPWPA